MTSEGQASPLPAVGLPIAPTLTMTGGVLSPRLVAFSYLRLKLAIECGLVLLAGGAVRPLGLVAGLDLRRRLAPVDIPRHGADVRRPFFALGIGRRFALDPVREARERAAH